ncbi:MAG: DUF4870 domain-containing protein [Planctomycetes bacterium]|nr:DUF4870 domain-containing protein [Planctomycetota bacterium]MBL7008735.1 DUF4870 domain-containing protein [Planctomycetota bacterium]
MSQHQPYIEPPDPFSAVGPDGGHFQPGVPNEMLVPDSGPAPAPPPLSRRETRRAHRRDGRWGHDQRHGGPPPPSGGPGYSAPAGVLVGEERMWATLIPLSTFVAPFLGPLVLWLIFRDQYPGVDRAGRETLNFQISLVIYAAMFGVLSIILVGIPFLIMLPFFGFVCTVIAAFRTSRGERYEYPVTIRIL